MIRKRVAKGKAELESHRDSDEPATDGPQARMASRAAAVEQCCEVLLQYCTLTMRIYSPQGRIEDVEISHEAS